MQVQIDARLDDMQAQILAKVSFFEVNIECYSFKTFFIFQIDTIFNILREQAEAPREAPRETPRETG